jgi:hypothetical protein
LINAIAASTAPWAAGLTVGARISDTRVEGPEVVGCVEGDDGDSLVLVV